MTLLINITETISILIATLYFAFIGRNWLVIQAIGMTLHVTGLILAIIYRQESPRFLMKHGKIDQLISNMLTQAKTNGKEEEFTDFLNKNN